MMKPFAWMAMFALCLGTSAQAAVIDLDGADIGRAAASAPAFAPVSASTAMPLSDLAVTSRSGIVLPAPPMSELPEPEVFAMMLVGLILIGYRAGRDKSDKFK